MCDFFDSNPRVGREQSKPPFHSSMCSPRAPSRGDPNWDTAAASTGRRPQSKTLPYPPRSRLQGSRRPEKQIPVAGAKNVVPVSSVLSYGNRTEGPEKGDSDFAMM